MFETMLESQGLHDGEKKLGTLSAAALAHAGIGLAILAVTAMIVPPVHPPDPVPRVIVIGRGVMLDDLNHRPPAPAPTKGTDTRKPGRAVIPAPTAPQAPSAATPAVPASPAPADSDSAPDGPGEGPVGTPNGSPLGEGPIDGDGGPGSGGPSAEPVYLTGDIEKPVLLIKVEPSYPESARIARLGGHVTLRAVIREDGGIESVDILASSNPLFNRAAVDAVRQWRYRPALMNGKPVRIYFTVVVEFVLR
jgi:periplasmic protein TonB